MGSVGLKGGLRLYRLSTVIVKDLNQQLYIQTTHLVDHKAINMAYILYHFSLRTLNVLKDA